MAGKSRRSGNRSKQQRRIRFFVETLEDRNLLSATTTMQSDRFELPAAATSTTYYTPAQIRAAYGFNSASFGSTAANGAGQTIAIVDAYDDPNIKSDLATFDSAYGITAPPKFTIVNESGGSSLPRTDPSQGWEGETALDVEWAHAIAPGANILLVEASSASDTDLFAAVNYARNAPGVSVVSMSWGSNDNLANQSLDQSLSNTYLATPSGHQGVTFVAATGDHGVPGFPSTSPNVLAVGGTDLNLTSSGAITSETAWTPQNSGGQVWSGGGGVSQEFSGRETPDVSYNAGVAVSVYDTFGPDHGWVGVGGTSAGAPQWAALVAIADEGRVLKGMSTLDGASQTLPAIYQVSSADFHDITTGSTQTQSAGPGYDLATGRGSPVANLLIADLSGWSGSGGGTQTVTAPAAPANFTEQAISSTQVTLSWSASTGATGYSVYQQVNGQAVLVGSYGASTTSVTLSNLTASTTYTFDVAATNSAGSTASAWQQVTTLAAAVLQAPTVTATATSSTVANLSWTASTGAAGYTISYWNGTQAVQLGQVSASSTSVNVTGLTAGATYQFRVTAFNATTSAISAWVTVATPASLNVAAPTNVTATALSATTGQLSWSPSAGATGYEIFVLQGNRAVLLGTVAAGTTSVTIQGLARGSTNYFAVVAYNANSSAASAWVGLTTPASSSVVTRTAQSNFLADLAFAFYNNDTSGLKH